MCLIAFGPHTLVAREDITCYKVLILHRYNSDDYITPYQRHFCKIGDIIKSSKPMPEHIPRTYIRKVCNFHTYNDVEFRIISEGVHAWQYLCDAKDDLAGLVGKVIVEATIPKGTRYCKGNNGDIAAEQLVLNKIIK